MKNTSLSFSLHAYATTTANNLEALLRGIKESDQDPEQKVQLTQLKEIRDKFQPKHYKTEDPNIIGIGSIVNFTYQDKIWDVVVDNSAVCVGRKPVAIMATSKLGQALQKKKAGDTFMVTIGGKNRSVIVNSVSPYDAKTILAIITAAEKTVNTTAEPAIKEKEVIFTT